jgi:tRNA A-37 threonylcarbamoyl transferase component Bud32
MPASQIFLPERARDVERWLRRELPSEVVKENRGRAVWRVGAEPPRLYVKRFPPSLLRDRARQEARILQELSRAGLPCPRLVATVRDAAGSYLLTEEIPDARDLMDVLEGGGPAARRAAAAFGSLLRRLHDAGFDHRDLHAGNVLVRDGSLYVLDVHRAARGRAVSRAARFRALAFAAMSFRDRLPLTEILRFLRAYGIDEPGATREVFEGLRRRMEEHFASRQERCVRDGTGFGVQGGVYFRKGVDLEALLREVESGPETVVKATGKERLARLPSGRFIKRGPRGRTLQAWKNAHALGVRGIPTPRLDACGPGWVAGQWIDGPNLRIFCRDRWEDLSKPERDRLSSALAQVVRRMHALGIVHKDLKGANFVVSAEGVYVLDLDRVRLGGRVGRADRIRNLAQLNASISLPVSRSERLRFFRRYAGRDGELWARRREWIAEIMRLTVARGHHWPPRPASGG